MQLLLPEILVEARELSLSVTITGIVAGVLLGLTGWWAHRFWIVLFVTVAAGIFGLYEASLLFMQPLLAALLLAIAAGMLGLSLMRLLAFFAGGLCCVILVHTLIPSAHAPVVCFLAGGIMATLLFRLWMMLLTSFAGALLVAYCGLCIVEHFAKVDVVEWSDENIHVLNWLCVGVTLSSSLIQFFWDRWLRKRRAKAKEEESADPKKKSSKKSNAAKVVNWVTLRNAA